MGNRNTDILIIGAGACGLMAACELSKAGRKVIILEARDRIGGRIWPLPKEDFGYEAEGGAEFIHGEAPITEVLVAEAGFSITPLYGEIWSVRHGSPTKSRGGPTEDPIFTNHKEYLFEKLNEIKEDIPLAAFIDKYFKEEKYEKLRDWMTDMGESYDLADLNKISTLTLKGEWLGGSEWKQGRIKEGYGALLDYLESACKSSDVQIFLNKEVNLIEVKNGVEATSTNGDKYFGEKCLITVPLPKISSIDFRPEIPEKLKVVEKMGFGNAVKIILKFNNEWWRNAWGEDLSKTTFILSRTIFNTWWTQYPELKPVLTGWVSGREALGLKNNSDDEIIERGLDSLSAVFKVDKEFLKKELVASHVSNWPKEEFTKGAYSYATPKTKEAITELIKPIDNKIFFAGEALYSGDETATVEGALGSGKEAAARIYPFLVSLLRACRRNMSYHTRYGTPPLQVPQQNPSNLPLSLSSQIPQKNLHFRK